MIRIECEDCGGTGEVWEEDPLMPEGEGGDIVACFHCDGEGWIDLKEEDYVD